jgi:hypothetical protein
MLLTALPPAPPTPNTVMRGFSSRMSGIFKLIVMIASSFLRGVFNVRFRHPDPPLAMMMSVAAPWLVCWLDTWRH